MRLVVYFLFFKITILFMLLLPELGTLLPGTREWGIARAVYNEPAIRVLIGRGLSSIRVEGMDLKREIFYPLNSKKQNESDTRLHTRSGASGIRFGCNFSNFKFRSSGKLGPQVDLKVNAKRSQLMAWVSSPTGILQWEKDKYKGDFLIVGPDTKGKCELINEISLENYLSTLLPKEMNASWPIEALKAQAVSSRTYAIYLINQNQNQKENSEYYDLENSERHQVNGGPSDETASTVYATKETKGEVLVWKGNSNRVNSNGNSKVTAVFFHSKCGGKTLPASAVWDNDIPGIKSVECPFCAGHGDGRWKYIFKGEELKKMLMKVKRNKKMGIPSNSYKLTILGDKYDHYYVNIFFQDENNQFSNSYFIKKSTIRQYLGRDKILSNRFVLRKENDGKMVIYGEGRGHGVGLCQMGALEMAKRGWDYKRILKHYFPQHEIVKNYGW